MTKQQLSVLTRLYNGEKIDIRNCDEIDKSIILFLYNNNCCICSAPNPNPKGFIPCIYSISETGKAKLCEHKNNRNKLIWSWIRYIITTLIAIAAFIKSFFFI